MTSQITIGLIILTLLFSCNDTNKVENLKKIILKETDSIKILQIKVDTLSKKNIELKNDLNYWLTDDDIDKLKQQGIHDPTKDISENLYNNPQLIPYPAVLGGHMHFWKITLLGERWAIADFQDGHNGGEMLLKYEVQKDSSIKWTVFEHHLDK